ncbi:MAG TPA: hypothetical protein VGJ75_02710, partial [Dongiaceae bacterium]
MITAARSNQSGVFQQVDRDGYTRAAHAEHEGEKFVREAEAIPIDAIKRHQQPARQSLLDLAATVCHRRVGGLHGECMSIEQERLMRVRLCSIACRRPAA